MAISLAGLSIVRCSTRTTLSARSRESSTLFCEAQPSRRLIVGVANHLHCARQFIERGRDLHDGPVVLRVEVRAARGEQICCRQGDDGSPTTLGHCQDTALFLGAEQLLQGRTGLHRRRWLHLIEPDFPQRNLQWLGSIGKPHLIDGEHHGEDGEPRRSDHPPGHVANQRVAPIFEPAPRERQLRGRRTADIANSAIEVVLDGRELLVPASIEVVLSP